ncbi:MAG: transcriptional regulator [Planctomycetes bacterium]|nr:transcriptional regulator [Planctomycetota bacterium]
MGHTRPFSESVKERAQNDPDFRSAMLAEAAECFLNGEPDVAKGLLRSYVNATIGFQELGKVVGKNPKSLMRMLGAEGNPRAQNLSALIASLQKHEGVHLEVRSAG